MIVRLHFARGLSGQGDMQKGSFQMESSMCIHVSMIKC